MGSTVFRDPQALSSTLAALGSPQLRPSGSLNTVEPLVSVSNYYIVKFNSRIPHGKLINEDENLMIPSEARL